MISSCSFATERLVVTGWYSALTGAQRQAATIAGGVEAGHLYRLRL
jgi:hypothetical protein